MGPRKIDGVLQADPPRTRKIRLWATGTGSANDGLAVDLSVTTYGYYHCKQSAESGDESLLCAVAAESWVDGQLIEAYVEGDVTVNVASTVAAKDLVVASGTAGRLQERDLLAPATVNQANLQAIAHYVTLGVALTGATSNEATIRLFNPQRL